MVVERVAVAMVDVVTDGGMAWLCAACSQVGAWVGWTRCEVRFS